MYFRSFFLLFGFIALYFALRFLSLTLSLSSAHLFSPSSSLSMTLSIVFFVCPTPLVCAVWTRLSFRSFSFLLFVLRSQRQSQPLCAGSSLYPVSVSVP